CAASPKPASKNCGRASWASAAALTTGRRTECNQRDQARAFDPGNEAASFPAALLVDLLIGTVSARTAAGRPFETNEIRGLNQTRAAIVPRPLEIYRKYTFQYSPLVSYKYFVL